MFLRKSTRIIKEVSFTTPTHVHSAYLLWVEGNSSLKVKLFKGEDIEYRESITLNDIPLLQSKRSFCPTCAHLIATGNGNLKIDSLLDISKKVNNDFISLKQSIDDYKEVINLLEPGLYIIADMEVYPTDGIGNFFWNTKSSFVKNPATIDAYTWVYEFDNMYLSSYPAFLYPTQNTSFFNEERVQHYVSKFRKNETPARALVYNSNGFISFVLDGHHKICASALLGKPANALTIIPYNGYITNFPNTHKEKRFYVFNSFNIEEKDIPLRYRYSLSHNFSNKRFNEADHNLNTIQWEEKYIESSKKYPTIGDLSLANGFNYDVIEDSLIEELLISLDSLSDYKLLSIVGTMSVKNDSRLKKVAMSCVMKRKNKLLSENCVKILLNMKEDSVIEDFFIDILAQENRIFHYEFLKNIIPSYWD